MKFWRIFEHWSWISIDHLHRRRTANICVFHWYQLKRQRNASGKQDTFGRFGDRTEPSAPVMGIEIFARNHPIKYPKYTHYYLLMLKLTETNKPTNEWCAAKVAIKIQFLLTLCPFRDQPILHTGCTWADIIFAIPRVRKSQTTIRPS